MMALFDYDDIFQRNKGLITASEQKKIRNTKLLIVGAGGIGGWTAELLARMGFEKITIADPEDFEISNLNRQSGSHIRSIGKNKAEVVGNFLKSINPNADIRIVQAGVQLENIEELVKNVDIIVDTIDFYAVDAEVELHKVAKIFKKPIFLAQVAGSKATFTNFSPTDPSLEALIFNKGRLDMAKSIKFFFPELPAESGKFILGRIIKGDKAVIPSYSTKPVITAALLTEDILKYVTKKRFCHFPEIGIYDFNSRTYKVLKRSV